MPIELSNPPALPEVPIYRQVAVATGSRQVFVAGQIARDADGEPIGAGDLAAQVEQCYLNLHAALAHAGATFDDLAKLTVYFVDWTPDKIEPFMAGVARACERLGVAPPLPPLTGIGVAALAEPDVLVEVDAVAVLP